MRQFLLGLLSIMFLQLHGNAQSKKKQAGMRAGLNWSTLTSVDGSRKLDFYGGVFATFNFSRLFALQPEIIYSRQGSKNADYEALKIPGVRRDINIHYLSFGMMSRFDITTKFHALIGPSIEKTLYEDYPSDHIRYRKNTALNDFSLQVGLAYKIASGLVIEGRIKGGAMDVFDNHFWLMPGDSPVNNDIIQIGVAYRLTRN